MRVTREHVEYQSAENKTAKKILRSRVIQIEYDNGTSVYLFEMKNEKNIPGKKSKYDKIFLDKDRIIKGKIIEVTPKFIRYLPNNKNKPKLINRKIAIKIVYANGTVVLLKKTAAIQPDDSSFSQKKRQIYIIRYKSGQKTE